MNSDFPLIILLAERKTDKPTEREREREIYSDGTEMSEVVTEIKYLLCLCNIFSNFLRHKRKATGKVLSK
jgi:hypothetical protein